MAPLPNPIAAPLESQHDKAVQEVLKDLRIAMMEKWISRDRFIRFLDRGDESATVDYEVFYDVVEQFGLLKTDKNIDFQLVFDILDTEGTGKVPIDAFMEALTDSSEDLAIENDLVQGNELPPFPSPYFVGLVAHNNMKPSMMKFVKDNLSFFKRVKLVTTGSTGRALATLGLEVEHKVSSGPLGGDQEIGSLIAQGKVSAIFFFTDPLSAHAHNADVEALNRICCVHDIFIASNPSTAKCVVHAMEHSTFGYTRMTGLNVGRSSEVVEQYKKGQEQIIKSVMEDSTLGDSRTTGLSLSVTEPSLEVDENKPKKGQGRMVKSKREHSSQVRYCGMAGLNVAESPEVVQENSKKGQAQTVKSVSKRLSVMARIAAQCKGWRGRRFADDSNHTQKTHEFVYSSDIEESENWSL